MAWGVGTDVIVLIHMMANLVIAPAVIGTRYRIPSISTHLRVTTSAMPSISTPTQAITMPRFQMHLSLEQKAIALNALWMVLIAPTSTLQSKE